MWCRIDEEYILGNLIIAKNGECITVRQFLEYVDLVTKRDIEDCLVSFK